MHLPIDDTNEIADLQSGIDSREINVDKVGVKNVRHPVSLVTLNGEIKHTIANFSMFVNLPHHIKGTHMSRFIEILNENKLTLTEANFSALLFEVTKRLHSDNAYIDIDFPYFVEKEAPISKAKSVMDYDVALYGMRKKNITEITVKVIVPVTSLCPCSKEISDYGAHNQRSHVTVEAQITSDIWIDELIKMVEKHASCDLYGILKRPDEKYVTEHAYDNPKFVEDVVRDIAKDCFDDKRINRFKVQSENFESIHNHSAYAMIQGE